MIDGGIRSGATARSASRWTRAAGPASPGRRARPDAASCRGSIPWASMSDVIVSGPTQVIRAGQSSTAVVSWTSASGELRAPDHLARGPGLVRGRGAVNGLGTGQRGGHRAVLVG